MNKDPVTFEHQEKVRVVGEKPGSPNEFAAVDSTTVKYNSKGERMIWITNMNMPYCGSINEFVTLDKIERIAK